MIGPGQDRYPSRSRFGSSFEHLSLNRLFFGNEEPTFNISVFSEFENFSLYFFVLNFRIFEIYRVDHPKMQRSVKNSIFDSLEIRIMLNIDFKVKNGLLNKKCSFLYGTRFFGSMGVFMIFWPEKSILRMIFIPGRPKKPRF